MHEQSASQTHPLGALWTLQMPEKSANQITSRFRYALVGLCSGSRQDPTWKVEICMRKVLWPWDSDCYFVKDHFR